MIVKKYKGNKVSVALQRARDLITDPEHWTQKTFARDKNSKITSPNNPKAEKFCAVGALIAVDGPTVDKARRTLDEFGHIINTNDTYNRSTAHKKVLDHYNRAIKLAKTRERRAKDEQRSI